MQPSKPLHTDFHFPEKTEHHQINVISYPCLCVDEDNITQVLNTCSLPSSQSVSERQCKQQWVEPEDEGNMLELLNNLSATSLTASNGHAIPSFSQLI